MTLHAERQVGKQWVKYLQVQPGDRKTIPNRKEVKGTYILICEENDLKSNIYKVKRDDKAYNEIINSRYSQPIKTLRRGDPPFELRIQTDNMPKPQLVRFTHK